MAKLKLGAIADDKPVKLTLEFPALVHREPDRAASMRLRAERPRVTRLSRKVLAGGAAIGSLAICGAVLWALQNNRSRTSAPSELYTTDHHNVADGLSGLPRARSW